MKKIISSTLIILACVFFYSCVNNARNDSEMKSPTESKEAAENEINEKEESKAVAASTDKAKTIENLQAAFKGESNAFARYAAFAKKADEEGKKEAAELFRAAFIAERIHAQNHKEVLQKMGADAIHITPEVVVKSTKENLEYAITGEAYEVKDMYPAFLKDADASGSKLAASSLMQAYTTEKRHVELYRKALKALNANTTSSLAKVI